MIRRILVLCAVVALGCPWAMATEGVTIADISGRGLSPVEMIVEATLDGAATGIEIKAPLPASMEYVEGTAVIAEGRTDGHSISVGLKDGELRILIYSLSGKVLKGTEGELCRLQLKLGNEPGDFVSTPQVTAIGTGLDRREVQTDPFNITTTAPRIKVEDTQLDFGRIPTLVEHAQNVQVYNTGNDVLHITGYESTNSDISVSDVQAEILPGESYWFNVVYKATTPGEKNEKLTFISDAANSCPSVNIHSQPYLANEVYYTVEYDEANDDYVVTMNLSNQEEIVAIDTWFEFYSNMKYVEGSAQVTGRASDHQVIVSSEGYLTHVIMYSLSSAPLSGQDGAVLTMKFKHRSAWDAVAMLRWGGDVSLWHPTILGTKNGKNVDTLTEEKLAFIDTPERPWECQNSSASAYADEEPVTTILIGSYENTSLVIEQVKFDDPDFVCDEQMPISFPSEWSEKELKVRYKGKEYGKHSTNVTVETNRGSLSCTVEFTLLDTKFDCQTTYTADDFSSCVVDVDMKSIVDIAAMQMDIILPDSRPDIQLNENDVIFGVRMSAHSHVLSKVGDRQYRLIVYSMSNQAIAGNEGVVLSLPLFSSENLDLRAQQIELRNIVLSDTKGKSHVSSDTYYQLAPLYRVTFMVEGESVYRVLMEYGSAITAPEAPVKEGHTFAGWTPEVDEIVPNYDVTYEALFQVNKYAINYLVDSDKQRVDSLEYGSPIVPAEVPTKEGHTFSGWSETPETMPAHDIEVTGSFTVDQYRLSFVVDGDTLSSAMVDYGTELAAIDAPVREGETFSGWSTLPKTMPARDVVITGTFSANSYKLTYKVDGEVYEESYVVYGTTLTAIDEPTKEGYTFSGWSELPETMPADDVEVEGSFSVIQYLVTFLVEGDSVYSEMQDYGTEIVAPEKPEKEGYTFTGWSPVVDTTVPSHDAAYEAQFTVNTYKVRYYVLGELVYEDEVDFGETYTLYEYTPEEGYIFEGWSGEFYETMPAHDVEYHADIINGIPNAVRDTDRSYYDLLGRKLNTHNSNGVTIIRLSDGRSMKVVK